MKKILLIEDNKQIRENTAEILELANYKVLTSKNGKEGVAAAQKEKPDVIICDIMMPELDGYGVLHMLSKDAATATIPFIFLTAKTERSDMRKGMEMGADDYLTKPFSEVELLNAIESRLKKADVLNKEYQRNIEGLNEFISEANGLDKLKKLSEETDVTTYTKKEPIYRAGAFPKGLYLLLKGKIKASLANEDGKEFVTGLYKEGDFFGYLALMEDTRHTDNAVALEDSDVCLIPRENFYDLLYKNADVSRKFIKMLSDNLRDKESQLLKLAYNSVRKRIAESLVTLHDRYKKDGEKQFSMNISREDLASMVGTASETLIRTLSDFKEEKLIEVKGRDIVIVNYDKLAKRHN
jgi:CRP/FNR family transcriptional regulator, polysaccharide utilization system transcription regulator